MHTCANLVEIENAANETIIAKIGVDGAEIEPTRVWPGCLPHQKGRPKAAIWGGLGPLLRPHLLVRDLRVQNASPLLEQLQGDLPVCG